MVTAYNYQYSFPTFIDLVHLVLTEEQIIRLFTCGVLHSYHVTLTDNY